MSSTDHRSFEIRRRLPRSPDWPARSVGFALAVAGVASIPYLMTIAPSISWRNGGIDSGELVTAMYILGIPHPTGFPLYMILGRLFMFLPIGEIAYRANLLSTACAAGTVGLIVATGISINRRQSEADWPAILAASATGGLAFAFSPLFWARATIAKEYTLNTFFLAAGLLLLIDWRSRRQASRLVAFAGMIGLGMADHVTSLSLLPGALAFILLVDPRSAFRRSIVLRGILVILLGLSLYAYIPIRAATVPYIDWGNPAALSTFYDHVSGATYKNILTNALKPLDIEQRILFGIRGIPDQLGWPGLVGLLIGIWVTGQRDRPVLALLGVTGLINLTFASMYPVRDSESYLLPFYLSGAIVASVGFCEIYRIVLRVVRLRWRYSVWFAVALLVAVTAGLAENSIARSFQKVDLSHDTSARDYGRAVLAAAPTNAVVITNHDETTFSLWYVQQVLGERRDNVVIDERLMGWPWYRLSLARYYPDLGLSGPSPQSEQRLMRGDVPGRPVYVTTTPDFGTGRVSSTYLTPRPRAGN